MSKWQCYSDRKAHMGVTLAMIYEALPEDEKNILDSTRDSWAHLAPEASETLWHRIYELLSRNFHDVQEGGKHEQILKIYNTRYKDFRNKWYNDNADGGIALENKGVGGSPISN
tara:strand:+ start:460 stop:801 length:342 start_codon:yes stop_codon:yes gene_type:complete